jgi:hypothetical protein
MFLASPILAAFTPAVQVSDKLIVNKNKFEFYIKLP